MAQKHFALSVRGACLGLVCAALSACAALSPSAPPGSRPAGAAARTDETEASSAQAINPASSALLAQSRADRAAGRLDDGEYSIERALRIDPNNPLLWIELAEIKLAQDDRNQAVEMARKALTLAGSDRSIRERADRLLNP